MNDTLGVTVKIFVHGHVDDLYALALLFPEGAYPQLHVVTQLKGEKDGPLDRVTDASDRQTFVTGAGCLPLLEKMHPISAGWVAREIIAPLNGYATLADSNYTPVEPTSASFENGGGQGYMVFGGPEPNRPRRGISVSRSPLLHELLASRLDYMTHTPLAAYAAAVIAGQPSWAEYYRLLEDIAGVQGTTLDKLDEAGIAAKKPLNAFKKAANNRAFAPHGLSKRDAAIPEESMMNLLEAREFVRNVVCTWLDHECGGRMPRDRVDGGILRFGLDHRD
jgi:hypothetical protein